MPRRRLFLLLALLPPASWPALLPAASIEMRAADGKVRRAEAPALRQGEDSLGDRIEAQFRSTYYYSLAVLAGLQGLQAESEVLLKRAADADPGSVLLRREHAEALVGLGKDEQAVDALEALLKEPSADLDLRRELARAYVRLGRKDEARGLFLNEDGSDPSDPGRLRSLVGLDLADDRTEDAERRLARLVQAGGDADDRELLGVLLQKQQRFQEAAAAYRGAVEKDPERAPAWARLGACYESQGDTPAALKALAEGLAALPDSALLADQLGRLSYRAGLYDAADAAFSRLVSADPTDADSLLHRGLARLKGSDYAGAEADFSALGKLQEESPSQWYGLALALTLQKKYAQAEAALKKVLALNPKAEPAWVQLAAVHERQGDLGRAAQTLADGLKELPDNEELALLLSSARQEQGDLDAAKEVLRASLRHGGGDAVRFQLAVLLDKQGDFKAAETELQALLKRSPRHAQALNYLGYSWADRGQRLPEAEALIRRALELDPDNHYYQDSLGWTLFKESRAEEAEAVLRKASEALAPGAAAADAEEALVFEHWASALGALGREKDAAAARARAAEIRRNAAKASRPDAPGAGELP